MMKIYTYGIIDSNGMLEDSIKGLEGAPVYNIAYRDIGIAASELYRQADINEESASKHEKVVERLMEDFTVLPMRFLTLFNAKEDTLSMMKEYYDDFKKNLERLRNKVEFGIKVIWPGDAIKECINDASAKESHKAPVSDDSPGRRYIKEKYKEYMIGKEFEKEADKRIAAIDDLFNKLAIEKRLERLKSRNLLLKASYLVERRREDDFKKALESLKSTSGDLKYLFSGPWPPYNFITLSKRHGQKNN